MELLPASERRNGELYPIHAFSVLERESFSVCRSAGTAVFEFCEKRDCPLSAYGVGSLDSGSDLRSVFFERCTTRDQKFLFHDFLQCGICRRYGDGIGNTFLEATHVLAEFKV